MPLLRFATLDSIPPQQPCGQGQSYVGPELRTHSADRGAFVAEQLASVDAAGMFHEAASARIIVESSQDPRPTCQVGTRLRSP